MVRLGPSAATKARASKSEGNESMTSTTVMITVSTRPAEKPLINPSPTPSVDDSATAQRPTKSEIRAPWIIRLNTSRPM